MKLININNLINCKPQYRLGGIQRIIIASCKICFQNIKDLDEWCNYIERGLIVLSQEIIADKPRPSSIGKQVSDCEGKKTIGYEFTLNLKDYNGLIEFTDFPFWNEILTHPERYQLAFLTCDGLFFGFYKKFNLEGGYVIPEDAQDLAYWDIQINWRGYQEKKPIALPNLIQHFQELCKSVQTPRYECCPLLFQIAENARVFYDENRKGYGIRTEIVRQRSISAAPCAKYKNVSLCFQFGSQCFPIDTGNALPKENPRDIQLQYLDVFIPDTLLISASIDLEQNTNIELKLKYECENVDFNYEAKGPTLVVGKKAAQQRCCPITLQKVNEIQYFPNEQIYRFEIEIQRQEEINCKNINRLVLKLLVNKNVNANEWSVNTAYVANDQINPSIDRSNFPKKYNLSIPRRQLLQLLQEQSDFTEPFKIGILAEYQCEGEDTVETEPLAYTTNRIPRRVCCPLTIQFANSGPFNSSRYIGFEENKNLTLNNITETNVNFHSAQLTIRAENNLPDTFCDDYKNVELKIQFYARQYNFTTNRFEYVPAGEPLSHKTINQQFQQLGEKTPFLTFSIPNTNTITPVQIQQTFQHAIIDCGFPKDSVLDVIGFAQEISNYKFAHFVSYLRAIKKLTYNTVNGTVTFDFEKQNPREFVEELVRFIQFSQNPFTGPLLAVQYILEYQCASDNPQLPKREAKTEIRNLSKPICCYLNCEVKQIDFDANTQNFKVEVKVQKPAETIHLDSTIDNLQQWENVGAFCQKFKYFAYSIEFAFNDIKTTVEGIPPIRLENQINPLSNNEHYAFQLTLNPRQLYQKAYNPEVRTKPLHEYLHPRGDIAVVLNSIKSCCTQQVEWDITKPVTYTTQHECFTSLIPVYTPSCCELQPLCRNQIFGDGANLTPCIQENRVAYNINFQLKVNAPTGCELVQSVEIYAEFYREGYESQRGTPLLLYTLPASLLPLTHEQIIDVGATLIKSQIEQSLPPEQRNKQSLLDLYAKIIITKSRPCEAQEYNNILFANKSPKERRCCNLVFRPQEPFLSRPVIPLTDNPNDVIVIPFDLAPQNSDPNIDCGPYEKLFYRYIIRNKNNQQILSQGDWNFTTTTTPSPIPLIINQNVRINFSFTYRNLCTLPNLSSICNTPQINEYEIAFVVQAICNNTTVTYTSPFLPFSQTYCCPGKLVNSAGNPTPLKNPTFTKTNPNDPDGYYTLEYKIIPEGQYCEPIIALRLRARIGLLGQDLTNRPIVDLGLFPVSQGVFNATLWRKDIIEKARDIVPIGQEDFVQFSIQLIPEVSCNNVNYILPTERPIVDLLGVPEDPRPCCPIELVITNANNKSSYDNDGKINILIENINFVRNSNCRPLTSIDLAIQVKAYRINENNVAFEAIFTPNANHINIDWNTYLNRTTGFAGSFNLAINQEEFLPLIGKTYEDFNNIERLEIIFILTSRCQNFQQQSIVNFTTFFRCRNYTITSEALSCVATNPRFRVSFLVPPNSPPIVDVALSVEFTFRMRRTNNNIETFYNSHVFSLQEFVAYSNQYNPLLFQATGISLQNYNFPISHNESINTNKGYIVPLDYVKGEIIDTLIKKRTLQGIEDKDIIGTDIVKVFIVTTCKSGHINTTEIQFPFDYTNLNRYNHFGKSKRVVALQNAHIRIPNINRTISPTVGFDPMPVGFESDTGTIVTQILNANNNQALAFTFGMHIARLDVELNKTAHLFFWGTHRNTVNKNSFMFLAVRKTSGTQYNLEFVFANSIPNVPPGPTSVETSTWIYNNAIVDDWAMNPVPKHIAFTFFKPTNTQTHATFQLFVDGNIINPTNVIHSTTVFGFSNGTAPLNSDILIGGIFKSVYTPPSNGYAYNQGTMKMIVDNLVMLTKVANNTEIQELKQNLFTTLAFQNRFLFVHFFSDTANNDLIAYSQNCFPQTLSNRILYSAKLVTYTQPNVTAAEENESATNLGPSQASFTSASIIQPNYYTI